MSLETNLELNNKLLTQQNELQARNIALLERLVSTLASGVTMRPDTVAKVQEYREAVPEPQPDFAELRKQAEERILRLAKGGYLAEAKAILAEFGAQKMGQVPDDKLADVISLTEKALEG